jgi:hypothetical protein
MKRSLLSSFDPLPHALSTKGLSALVGIVVLGIGVTVERYLESSQAATHYAGSYSALERPGTVLAAPGLAAPDEVRSVRDPSTRSAHDFATRRTPGCRSWSGSSASQTCPRAESTTTKPAEPTTPSLFQPQETSGS